MVDNKNISGVLMAKPRYAICFAPEQDSALEDLGCAWLGRDKAGKFVDRRAEIPGIAPDRLTTLLKGPRGYGMHGTLKPSFELRPHATEGALLTVAELIAKSCSPLELPVLEIGEVGYIVSLVPDSSSAALENLAAVCVRAFDGFRRPLTEDEEQSYKRNRLTVHQRQMLEHWGYPYVMEEFDFHISLTDPVIDEHERAAIMLAAERAAANVLHKPLTMRELAVFSQMSSSAPMSIIARFPFGRG
jgi:hypothetical protein